MADELDPRLEARLREVLRHQADALPFTLTVADVHAVRRARHSAAARLRVPIALLASAAAIVIVVTGLVAWRGAALPPSGTESASPNPLSAELSSYAELASGIAIIDGQVIARGEELVGAPASGEAMLGTIPANDYVDVVFDCRGGRIEVMLRMGATPGGDMHTTCDPISPQTSFSMPGFETDGAEVWVKADPGTVWRMIVAGTNTGGQLESAGPATLPTFDDLAAVATSTHEVSQTEVIAAAPGTTSTQILQLGDLWNLEVAVGCTGPGDIQIETSGTGDTSSRAAFACDGAAMASGLVLLDIASERTALAALSVVAPPGVAWRVIVYDRSKDTASPSAGDFELASYEELEAQLASFSAMPVIARGEHPVAETGSELLRSDLGPVGEVGLAHYAYSCSGGSIWIDRILSGDVLSGYHKECSDTPEQFGDGSGPVDPSARFVVTAAPDVVWRVMIAGTSLPEEGPTPPAPTASPSLPPVTTGSTELVSLDITAADGEVTRRATAPEGTDRYVLHASCSGGGTLELSLDGVQGYWDCGALGTEVFVPGEGSTGPQLTASVTGGARFLLRLDAVDLSKIPNVTWQPPALTLAGPDAFDGGFPGMGAFPGCGWVLQAQGSNSSESCGPSWQPMATKLVQRAGTSVTVMLPAGWTITGITGSMARQGAILPSGRAPAEQPWTGTRTDARIWTFPAPPLGDWGLRLIVNATRDGDEFQVPYYARIYVIK